MSVGRVSTGQIIVAQLAFALVLTGLTGGTFGLVTATTGAIVLLLLAFGRFRGRWLYIWMFVALRFAGQARCQTVPDRAALLRLFRPDIVLDTIEIDLPSVQAVEVGVMQRWYGLGALIEIGDTAGILTGTPLSLPDLATLASGTSADSRRARLQLVLHAIPAPTVDPVNTGTARIAATAYRQLAEGRVPARQRLLLAVRVDRRGDDTTDELRHALRGSARRVLRRLHAAGLVARPLGPDSVGAVLAELTHHDPARPVHQRWTMLDIGGHRQIGYRIWPPAGGFTASMFEALLLRLATLACSSYTVSLDLDAAPVLTVCLAAPTELTLDTAGRTLCDLLDAAGARGERLDGAHLAGLARTLPLGGGAVRSRLFGGVTAPGSDGEAAATTAMLPDGLPPIPAREGLVLGLDRGGEPVTARLFRPEPTRAALVGTVHCAQTLVLRALAVGARVVVRSIRPDAWEPFLRGLSGGEPIELTPPLDSMEPQAQVDRPTPGRPELTVLDVDGIGPGAVPDETTPWRTTLVVRDQLTPTDVDVLVRSHLVLLQPLTPAEAELVAGAFGLGDSAGWLTRISADMIGIVVQRRTVRWARLSSTPVEQHLIGSAARQLAEASR